MAESIQPETNEASKTQSETPSLPSFIRNARPAPFLEIDVNGLKTFLIGDTYITEFHEFFLPEMYANLNMGYMAEWVADAMRKKGGWNLYALNYLLQYELSQFTLFTLYNDEDEQARLAAAHKEAQDKLKTNAPLHTPNSRSDFSLVLWVEDEVATRLTDEEIIAGLDNENYVSYSTLFALMRGKGFDPITWLGGRKTKKQRTAYFGHPRVDPKTASLDVPACIRALSAYMDPLDTSLEKIAEGFPVWAKIGSVQSPSDGGAEEEMLGEGGEGGDNEGQKVEACAISLQASGWKTLSRRHSSSNSSRLHHGGPKALPAVGESSDDIISGGEASETADASNSREQAGVWKLSTATYSRSSTDSKAATNEPTPPPDHDRTAISKIGFSQSGTDHFSNFTSITTRRLERHTIRSQRKGRGAVSSLFKPQMDEPVAATLVEDAKGVKEVTEEKDGDHAMEEKDVKYVTKDKDVKDVTEEKDFETATEEKDVKDVTDLEEEVVEETIQPTAPESRPPDSILIGLFRKDSPFMKSIEDEFCTAVDLWARNVLAAYKEMSLIEGNKTGKWIATVSLFRDLIKGLSKELFEVQAQLELPHSTIAPGSWRYLDDPKIIDCLNEKPYHQRLIHVLRVFGFRLHHWSAMMYVRCEWCRLAGKEPQFLCERGYTDKELGSLEFVMKQFLWVALQKRVNYTGNKAFLQHLLDISASYAPTIETAWWIDYM
ncbi:hypothetical protein BJ508DRAFT_337940 [Ascobolus immersus RN42]|uniref:Uncharacterized protein n=1 Tax=Ascobolus immersus RN42 TaxID=1160509 RepID=A0A3N4HQR1_ASCIM|nr:hypothetical protein BJ508DRAFT_337940 [Ascobolus immersus RN42]